MSFHHKIKGNGLLVSLFLLLIFLPVSAYSDTPSFEDGVNLYNRGGYWEALSIFSILAESDPATNPKLTASAYMRIRCYYQLGFFQRALLLGQSFRQEFPQSSYLDDLDFLAGEIYAALGNPREAAWYMARAAVFTEDRKLRRTAREWTESLVLESCSTADLQALASRSIDRTGQYLALLASRRYMNEGHPEQALDILFNMRPFIKDSDLVRHAIETYSSFKSSVPDTLHLAMILPLSGGLAAIGDELLDGMRYAGMEFVDSTGLEIQFHVFDNEGELGETIRIAREIQRNPHIDVVLGPLTNENVKGASAVLAGTGIPILTPTATEDYLASLASETFQFRATRERKANALAEYAVEVLGLHTFAVIAPSTEYGLQMADNFAQRVDELGGEILYQGWYVGEPTDLSTYHFRRLREIGIEEYTRLMEADTIPDTLIIQVGEVDSMVIDTVSEYARILEPILEKEAPTYSDSNRVKLAHIDAIFFPIHRGSITYIASQFAHNNLESHVLGDENWIDLEALKKNKRYLPLLTIVAGDRQAVDDDLNEDMVKSYWQLYRREPGQYDLLGYDALGCVLKASLQVLPHYTDLRQGLIDMAEYEGYLHDVKWGGHTGRENDRVYLLNHDVNRFTLAGYVDNQGFFAGDSIPLPVEQ